MGSSECAQGVVVCTRGKFELVKTRGHAFENLDYNSPYSRTAMYYISRGGIRLVCPPHTDQVGRWIRGSPLTFSSALCEVIGDNERTRVPTAEGLMPPLQHLA